MFKGISSVVSFLTIIPSKNSELETVAKNMYLFPVAGALIGLIIGASGYGLSLFLQPLITGLILTGALAIITGMHHTDALCDFADGIMAKGTKEKKLQAMRDPAVGSAGVMTVVLYAGGMILAISMIKGFALFEAILLSELMAKLSMVIQANRGLSAWQGLSSPFTQYMKDPRKLVVAVLLTITPAVILAGVTGVFVVISCVGLSFLLLVIANRSFGGISGDVFGASNELVRLASLLIFASV
ncbi:adenosylcobinamide-GDP ribazoletransferase [Candidatus Nitrosotalea okcheonensis]|uniref:Adenosylcobinamide-GDP ribazoletransferase n=1 Tax=Candidatus Nitrosotalea okcheonensis TaxID=1903276 RepID=A0A2H1FGM7_9ARCH|nr:adenosylcobinamide-GDP ribazoletransferase [Candidatus Nitrosotalea okcheonensis]SMH71913.1 Cobalamin synthase [Candidatus Nitrosotalea okcheonensis]